MLAACTPLDGAPVMLTLQVEVCAVVKHVCHAAIRRSAAAGFIEAPLLLILTQSLFGGGQQDDCHMFHSGFDLRTSLAFGKIYTLRSHLMTLPRPSNHAIARHIDVVNRASS